MSLGRNGIFWYEFNISLKKKFPPYLKFPMLQKMGNSAEWGGGCPTHFGVFFMDSLYEMVNQILDQRMSFSLQVWK